MSTARCAWGILLTVACAGAALAAVPPKKSVRSDPDVAGLPLVAASQRSNVPDDTLVPGQFLPGDWYETFGHQTYICRAVTTGTGTCGDPTPNLPCVFPLFLAGVAPYETSDPCGRRIICIPNYNNDWTPSSFASIPLPAPSGASSTPPSGWSNPPGPSGITPPTVPTADTPYPRLDGSGTPPPEGTPSDLENHPVPTPVPNCTTELMNQGGMSQPWGAGNGEIVINGIGAASGSPLRADDIGGISSTDGSGVLASKGYATEDVDDLTIQLPGRDFVLTRSFTGTDEYNDWNLWKYGIADNGGWTLSSDTMVLPYLRNVLPADAGTPTEFADDYQTETDLLSDTWKRVGTVVVRGSPSRYTVGFQNITKYRPRHIGGGVPDFTPEQRREFEPTAPSPWRLLADIYHDSHDGDVPVWVLTSPGGGTTLFFRESVNQGGLELSGVWNDVPLTPPTGEAFPVGRIYKQFDEFGNVWTYRYGHGDADDQGVSENGLRTIYLHGTSDGDALAAVDFFWSPSQPISEAPTGGSNPAVARIAKVIARRRNLQASTEGNGPWYRTHEVYYTYLGEVATMLDKDINNDLNYLGHWPSDLSQVTFRTALNPPVSVATAPETAVTPVAAGWHAAVTQYRYAFTTTGSAMKRQIKAIFTPRQVEQIVAAKQVGTTDARIAWSVPGDADYFLEAGAVNLLNLTDTAPVESTDHLVWHYASKYVQFYTTPAERRGRVMREYSMPGPKGQTKMVEFVFDNACENELTSTLSYDPDGPGELAPVTFDFFAVVQTSREYVRRTDASAFLTLATSDPVSLTATSDPNTASPATNQWSPRLVVKRRTEDRPLFFLSWANGPGANLIPQIAQVTTAESKTELNGEGGAQRTWITKYVVDRFNRVALTYRPEAVQFVTGVTYQNTRLRDCELWVRDSLLGAVEGTVYADDIEGPGQASGTIDVTRTLRVGDTYRGAGSSAETLTHTLYSSGTTIGRMDLPSVKYTYLSKPGTTLADDQKQIVQYRYTVDTPSILTGHTWDAGTFWQRLVTRLNTAVEIPEPDAGSSGLPWTTGSNPPQSTVYTFTPPSSPTTETNNKYQLRLVNAPDGTATTYLYDYSNGRTVRVTKSASGTSETLASSAVYDLMGRRLSVKTANGESAAWRYGVSNLSPLATTDPIDLPPGITNGTTPPDRTGLQYEYALRTPQLVKSDSPNVYSGPIVIAWTDAEGGSLRACNYLAAGVSLTQADGPIVAGSNISVGAMVTRSESLFDPSGRTRTSSSWAFPSTGGVFPSSYPSTNVLTSATEYEGDGQVVLQKDPTGAFTTTEYDAQGRARSVSKGMVSPAATAVEVARTIYDGVDSSDADANPIVGIGEGKVSVSVTKLGSSSTPDNRIQRTWYDVLHRPVLTRAGWWDSTTSSYQFKGPYSLTKYDYAGRVTLTATVDDTQPIATIYSLAIGSDSGIITSSYTTNVTTTHYTQRGLVDTAARLGTLGTATTLQWFNTRTWFDNAGRTVTIATPEGLVTKTHYDLLARTDRAATVTLASGATTSQTASHWMDIDAGVRLEDVQTAFHTGTTLPSMVTKRVRAHDDTSTDLYNFSLHAITTYSATLYDHARRVYATVNYGTNETTHNVFGNGTTPSVPTVVAIPDDTNGYPSFTDAENKGVTARTEYDSRGYPHRAIVRIGDASPLTERVTTTYTDGLGRAFATIENHQTAGATALSWSTSLNRWVVSYASSLQPDQDRVSSTVFDSLGQSVKRVAHRREAGVESGSQVTLYNYTWSSTGPTSGLATPLPSNSLLYSVAFPTGTGEPGTTDACDQVYYSYNLAGEQVKIKDQNGTVRESWRDEIGRLQADCASTIGSGQDHDFSSSPWSTGDFTNIDGTVRMIVTRYDRFSRVGAVISHSSYTTLPSGTASLYDTDASGVVNSVRYDYTPTGKVSALYQANEGPWSTSINSNTDPRQRVTRFSYTNAASPTDSSGYRERLLSMTYPDMTSSTSDDTTLGYSYPSGTLDDQANRAAGLKLTNPGSSSASDLVTYQRLGVATFAVTTYPGAALKMDRAVDSNNSAAASGGTSGYNGWDRFGRLRLNSWVAASGYSASGSTAAVWQEKYDYDVGGRRISRLQVRPNESREGMDWQLTLDNLDRLTTARKGTWRAATSGDHFTQRPRSQHWTLDELGNWKAYTLDTVNNDLLFNTTDSDNRRTHSASNELLTYGTQGYSTWTGQTTPAPANFRQYGYDGNGNIRALRTGTSGGTLAEQTTVDAWNRVTKVENRTFSSGTVQMEYRYNGLGWMVREEQHDTDAAHPVKRRWVYYSPSWQQLEELEDWTPETGTATPTVERRTQQFWGLRSANDAVLRRCDTDVDGDYDATDENNGGGAFFQLTDSLFSVVAHVRASDGVVACRFSYDSYGAVRTHLPGDFNGDGTVNVNDYDAFYAAYSPPSGPPLPSADWNGDGTVDAKDEDAFVSDYNAADGLSLSGPSAYGPTVLRIGYCGYVRDFNFTTRWLSRNRWYDSDLGRWVTRDPAGYTDGLNVYLYVGCNPFTLVDPSGLEQGFLADMWDLTKYAVGAGPDGAAGQVWGAGASGTGDGVCKALNRATGGRIDALNEHVQELNDKYGHLGGYTEADTVIDGAFTVLENVGPTGVVGKGMQALNALNRGMDMVQTGTETIKNVGAALDGDTSGLQGQFTTMVNNKVNGAVNSKLGGLGNVVNVNVAGSPGINVGGVNLTGPLKDAVNAAAQNSLGNNAAGETAASTPTGDYSNLPDPRNAGDGKDFTRKTRKDVLEENRRRNGGQLVDDSDGTVLVPSQQSQKGVTPPDNEAQVDHKLAKSKGGSNKPSNAQVLSRKNNGKKGNK